MSGLEVHIEKPRIAVCRILCAVCWAGGGGMVGLYVQKCHGLWIIYIVLSDVLLHVLRTKTAIQVHYLTGT